MKTSLQSPTIEMVDRITVVREDLCCPELPSGKLRGLIPWFHQLRQDGTRGVINHAVSYSNSHGIVGYAARETGLQAVSYVNCSKPTPQTLLGEKLGVRMIYSGPKQLGPLRAHAKKHQEEGFLHLPWALSSPEPYRFIADLTDLLPPAYTHHIVPVGGGGYAWAVDLGLRSRGRLDETVYGVITTGTKETNVKRLANFPPGKVVLLDPAEHGLKPEKTPFESDPNYEHIAWPVAKKLASSPHNRVCFWSVGKPLC